MSKVTVVWNNHGDGKLVGVLNDKEQIDNLKELVKLNNQQSYVRFIEVETNKIIESHLKPDFS